MKSNMKSILLKYIVIIIAMYFFHLIIANWAFIKSLIEGFHQKKFIFLDLKLFIVNFFVVLAFLVLDLYKKIF